MLGAALVLVSGISCAFGQQPPLSPYAAGRDPRVMNSPATGDGVLGSTPSYLTQGPPGQPYPQGAGDPGPEAFGNNRLFGGDRVLHGWLSADYLMLFPNPVRSPSLLQDGAGNTLIGGSTALGISHGVRLDSGLWVCEQRIAMQGISFFTFDAFAEASFPTGTIPLTGPLPPTPATNFNFLAWHRVGGGEGNMLYRFGDGGDNGDRRLYGLIGTKFLLLEEDVRLRYTLGNAETGGDFLDEFHTRNQFVGGQVGFIYSRQANRWSLDITGKVAVGQNTAQLTILGSNSAGINFQAFTGRSNIGLFEVNYFCVVPEVDANITYHVSERLSAHVGYNFLAMINTWRPGDQISLANDTGLSVPAATLLNSTYFLHGLNAGITFRY